MIRSLSLRRAAAAGAGAVLVGTLTAGTALGAGEPANQNTSKKLRDAVSAAGISEHLRALEAVADANGGNRFSALPGYAASVDYVVDRLKAAGYSPVVQEFQYLASATLGPSVLAQTAPGAVIYEEGTDYLTMDQSDAGDVTAPVTPVDLQLGLGNTSTSGCEAADFAGFPAGHIALLQRGSCTFQAKAENAAAAGAVGAIVFNQGNAAGRFELFGGTLSAAYSGGIPVVSTSYARGVEWAGTAGLTMRLFANVIRQEATTWNVFAETADGDPGNVVMAGAHLDSRAEGPGIQDNGSGSAAVLEVAEQMAKVKPKNKVRFAWWGAEESGLVGSTYYVNSLPESERGKIALYLNFDMIASPNYVRFVYDGDGSAFGLVGPTGSGAIEAAFHDYFAGQGLASAQTAFSGRSDYQAFINNGIPAGGLFTGAEGIKTAAEAAVFGGTAGVAYDVCYHLACDRFDNVNQQALEEMGDAVAHVLLTFAFDTRSVNGNGKGHPVSPPGQHVPGTPVDDLEAA